MNTNKKTCPYCRGSCECEQCDGKGTIIKGFSDSNECPRCNGSGKCSHCDGTGEVD